MLLRFGQIVHHPFTDYVLGQRLPPTPLFHLRLLWLVRLWIRLWLGVLFFLRFRIAAFQRVSNNANCSFESCSLLRLRCASRSSRSRLRYLFFSELSCWSRSQSSTTIFCKMSTSFGRLSGSIAGTGVSPEYRQSRRFPRENTRP